MSRPPSRLLSRSTKSSSFLLLFFDGRRLLCLFLRRYATGPVLLKFLHIRPMMTGFWNDQKRTFPLYPYTKFTDSLRPLNQHLIPTDIWVDLRKFLPGGVWLNQMQICTPIQHNSKPLLRRLSSVLHFRSDSHQRSDRSILISIGKLRKTTPSQSYQVSCLWFLWWIFIFPTVVVRNWLVGARLLLNRVWSIRWSTLRSIANIRNDDGRRALLSDMSNGANWKLFCGYSWRKSGGIFTIVKLVIARDSMMISLFQRTLSRFFLNEHSLFTILQYD